MAYLHHWPIIINPNHLWLMVLQGFSKHMELNNNSERNRYKFVNFDGEEKKIHFETKMNLFMASEDQWNSFIEKLLDETSKKLVECGKNLINLFKEKFSTSTREAEIANNVTILSSFKKYFKYSMGGTCGISKIIIEGTIEDWELLSKKVEELGNIDEEIVFWTSEMQIIIKKIIDTLKTRKPDLDFYKNIVQITDRNRECLPYLINGWIIKFIPYDKDGKKNNFNSPDFNGLTIYEIPSQMINLPFNITQINKNGQIKIHEFEIHSGFFGVK